MSSLKYDLRVGDTVSIDNGKIQITLLEKSGQRARLDISADNNIKIETKKDTNAATFAKNGVNLKM